MSSFYAGLGQQQEQERRRLDEQGERSGDEESDASSSGGGSSSSGDDSDDSSSGRGGSDSEGDDGDSTSGVLLEEGADTIGGGWAVYHDDEHDAPYFFNHITGVSQWHRPVIPAHLQQRHSAAAAGGGSWLGTGRDAAIMPVSSGGAHHKPSAPEEGEEDDDVEGQDGQEGLSSDSEYDDDPDAIRSQDDLHSAVNFYVLTLLFQVVVIEGPLCALEGLFKGLFCVLYGGCALLVAAAAAVVGLPSRPRCADIVHGQIVYGLELMAASATLFVPGGVLFAYKDLISAWRDGRLTRSAKVDDWVISAIPSFLGSVDSRKLRMICAGQGGYAANVRSLSLQRHRQRSQAR